jgi:hypothetical protein
MSNILSELKIATLRDLCNIIGIQPAKLKVELMISIKTAMIDDLTVAKLKEFLEKIGLPVSGVKKELLVRINEWRDVAIDKTIKTSISLDDIPTDTLKKLANILSIPPTDNRDEIISKINIISMDSSLPGHDGYVTVDKLREFVGLINMPKTGTRNELISRIKDWRGQGTTVPISTPVFPTVPTHVPISTPVFPAVPTHVPISAPTVTTSVPVPAQVPPQHDPENSDETDNPTKTIIQKIGKEQRETLSKFSQCSTKATESDKKEAIFNNITKDNQLDKYLKSETVDIDSLYLLLMLDDNEINSLYKKAMKADVEGNRVSKTLAILRNHTQLSKSANGKKSIPKPLKKMIWEKYSNGKCYCCCDREISMFDFDAGHIIPESKGGPTTIDNLRPICSSCNKSMNNRDMREYTAQYFPNSPLLKETFFNTGQTFFNIGDAAQRLS